MLGASPARPILVVGLGNPGKAYSLHRHNLGFMVVDKLAEEKGGSWQRHREKALVCQIRIEESPAVLVKPQTYMNLSGRAVAPILGKLHADPARMIVIHDDLDLVPGSVRIKSGGGDGGHKGVRSIADSLRFRDFIRVRMGIGRPPEGVPADEFVLSRFTREEAAHLKDHVSRGERAVRLILTLGLEQARNMIHSERVALASTAAEA